MLSLTLGLMGLASPASGAKNSLAIGEVAPTFTVKALNREVVNESSFGLDQYLAKGKTPKKLIILTFFATYCEPCKREMPFLAALYDEYGERGLQVMLVSIDKEPAKADVAAQLAKKNGVRFPVLADRFNILARRYLIEKLPCVYVISPDGKIYDNKVGYDDDATGWLHGVVRKGLAEPADAPIPESLKKWLEAKKGAAPTDGAVPVSAK
jgi:alkyl hydroperoxide reductase subunit AhpC